VLHHGHAPAVKQPERALVLFEFRRRQEFVHGSRAMIDLNRGMRSCGVRGVVVRREFNGAVNPLVMQVSDKQQRLPGRNHPDRSPAL
jgi:hypothetical protein